MHSADLIIHSARILTMSGHGPQAQAIAIKGNKIMAIG